MTFLSAEELAREVVVRVGPHADPQLAELLETAVFAIDHASSSWEASAGKVVAHHVRIAVPTGFLEQLKRQPALEDAVTMLVAKVFAARPDESLGAVSFAARESDGVEARRSPYR